MLVRASSGNGTIRWRRWHGCRKHSGRTREDGSGFSATIWVGCLKKFRRGRRMIWFCRCLCSRIADLSAIGRRGRRRIMDRAMRQLTSDFTRSEYESAVRRALEYIAGRGCVSGESWRSGSSAGLRLHPAEIYQRLVRESPAAYRGISGIRGFRDYFEFAGAIFAGDAGSDGSSRGRSRARGRWRREWTRCCAIRSRTRRN